MQGMPKESLPYYGLDVPQAIDGIIMAFDFGRRNIGIAVGQTITQTATPLPPLLAKAGIPEWHPLDKIVRQWSPVALLVGIPLNMDGSEQSLTEQSRTFALSLKARYALPVYGMDERLTSKDARDQLFTAGGYKALKNHSVDSLAACLILESFFVAAPH